jgi:hypothetical protein
MPGVLPSTIRQEKKVKSTQIRKEEIKLLLFVHNMTVYIENPKEPTENFWI